MAMGFSIHYRSTEMMHPARAYDIKQHADELIAGYVWHSCEPLALNQRSDGYLCGCSKPSYFPPECDSHPNDANGLPDGTVLTLAEVLCVLSREHRVDWDIGHDYEPDPIGQIRNGIADEGLIEQLETVGCIGDLLDDMLDEQDDEADDLENELEEMELGLVADDDLQAQEAEILAEDHGPRVFKFPGVDS